MIPSTPDRTEVVVVGGGIMGTATAYFLTERENRDVTLLEKDNVAAGSTGDTSGVLRHHYGPQERYTRMAWWSHRFYREFEERLGEPLAYDANRMVRFAEDGTTSGAYVEAGHDVLASLDIPVSRYGSDRIPDEFPMLALEDMDFAVSDDSAAYADGSDAANGFARAASERGATVVTGVGAEEILVEDDRVVGVRTTEGDEVAADAVVVAAGPWTPRLVEPLGIDVPITPMRQQVFILDPPEEYHERYDDPVPTTAPPGGNWYVRPDFGGHVLVATHHSEEAVDPDTYDDRPDEAQLLELVSAIDGLVPELADAEIVGQYCGVYSTTPDHDFVIDDAGPEGCYLACGFSGHGFKHGPAVGRIVSRLVVGDDPDLVDVEHFSLDRFEDDPGGHGLPDDNA